MQSINNLMKRVTELSLENSKNDYKEGGPFGALITDKDGNIISEARNTVLLNHDPTAHAEINAIRLASEKLGSHNLKDCVLYTSCYPCPMCLGAIVWSNIKTVYYGNTKEDAEDIGFRDNIIYEFIKGNNNVININSKDREITIKAFDDYKKNNNKKIY